MRRCRCLHIAMCQFWRRLLVTPHIWWLLQPLGQAWEPFWGPLLPSESSVLWTVQPVNCAVSQVKFTHLHCFMAPHNSQLALFWLLCYGDSKLTNQRSVASSHTLLSTVSSALATSSQYTAYKFILLRALVLGIISADVTCASSYGCCTSLCILRAPTKFENTGRPVQLSVPCPQHDYTVKCETFCQGLII